MYKVIHNFADNEDNGYVYFVGDKYPREGYETTLERATFLMGASNAIGVPLIEDDSEIMTPPVESADVAKEEPKPKRTRTTKARN